MRTLVKTTAAATGLVAAAAIGIALLGPTAQPTVSSTPELVAAADSVDAKTRAEIVRIAERELKGKHQVEGANNCNYYSGKMASNGCQPWCADFARYVWDQAGVKITGTGSGARSFRDYGKANKTWKEGSSPKKVKPGDAITYRLDYKGPEDDHVGIVTKVDKNGTITVISGNSGAKSDRVSKRVILDPKTAQITGYASPVAKVKPKGDNGKAGEKSNKSGSGTKQPATKSKSAPKPGQAAVIENDHLSLGG